MVVEAFSTISLTSLEKLHRLFLPELPSLFWVNRHTSQGTLAAPCPRGLRVADLWVGNCGGVPGEGRLREAAVFDPAVWYGLPEFDLALATMFGGFGEPFYETYHAIIPKAPGFERRMRVYKLYHYLNHLNLHGAGFGHGGTVEDPKGYYERSLTLMQEIVKDGFS